MGLIKKGLLGCTIVLALVVLVFAVVAFIAWLQVRSGEVATLETARDLDRRDRFSGSPSTAVTDDTLVPGPILIDLDITWALLIVGPAEHGRALSFSATYDPKRYALEESTEQEVADSGVHRVWFHPLGSSTMAALRPMVGGDLPRLDIELPPDVPMSIRASLTGGVAAFDLGKLQLVDADISMNTGVMQVMFREPTAWPMGNLELSCRRGNLVLYNMGHASPRRLTVHQGTGPGFFDLAGEWKADSEVEIAVAFGSGEVRVPNHVNVRGLEESLAEYNHEVPPGQSDVPPSTLDMNVHFNAGFIQVTRIPE